MRVPMRGLRRLINDFKRHPWLHSISILTICISLIISGLFLVIFTNFSKVADHTDPTLVGTLYLKEGISTAQMEQVRARIQEQEGVKRVDFKNRTDVLSELQGFLGTKNLASTPGSELFPDILEVELSQKLPSEKLQEFRKQLLQSPEIQEVDFSDDWAAQFESLFKVLRIVGVLVLGGVFVACSFIIANFMGLRHQSRKNEIDIVRLIGADPKFVMSPFLWEGIVEGIIGSCSAILFFVFVKSIIISLFKWHWVSMLGLQEWKFLSFSQVLCLFALGILMACSGSITVFLRFREEK